MRTLSTFILLLSISICFSCASGTHQSSGSTVSPDTLDRILVNQVGYLPGSVKIALLRVKADKFDVVEASSGKVVFSGKPGP